MAKLSAHGDTVGTLYLTTSAKRYMSDGVILKNAGSGWKLAGKVKPDRVPSECFERAIERQKEFLSGRPAYAAYRKELHAMTGLCNRWKLHCAVELMPDDCDGVWSEACDGYGDNVSASVDEVGDLCRLYKAAEAESKALKVIS